MPRSASTWLYNTIRLILISKYEEITCGWIGDRCIPIHTNCELIKIHKYDPKLVDASSFIFYSFRDVRDAMASAQRKFNHTPSMQQCDDFLMQYKMWTSVATFIMKYEDIMNDQISTIKEISKILDISVNPFIIHAELKKIRFNGQPTDKYDSCTLLHQNHITSDGKPGAWKTTINSTLISHIENKYKWWFALHNYN